MNENDKQRRSPDEAARLFKERLKYLERRDLLRLVEEQLKKERQTERDESYRWN